MAIQLLCLAVVHPDQRLTASNVSDFADKAPGLLRAASAGGMLYLCAAVHLSGTAHQARA